MATVIVLDQGNFWTDLYFGWYASAVDESRDEI